MNSMKHIQAQEEARARREAEERRFQLERETEADMIILNALLDAEREARRIEDAAAERRAGLEARVQAKKDELLLKTRQETRAAIVADSNAERSRADMEIEKDRSEAAAMREKLQRRYEQRREGYVSKVLDIVTGQKDE